MKHYALQHQLQVKHFNNLWEQPRNVNQQMLLQRLTSLSSELFLRVLLDVLPKAQERWMKREHPLSSELVWVAEHYRSVLAVDGSTLDALIRKIGLLQDLPENPLAGRMTTMLDLCIRLPEKFWSESYPKDFIRGNPMCDSFSKTSVKTHAKRNTDLH